MRVLLHGTPLSHFTRKVRILLREFEVPFELVRPSSLLTTTTSTYGDNPLMRVPTLVHAEETVFDSDHIARFLATRYDPQDRFGVLTTDVDQLNRLAVANGVMTNEVVLILAKRGGLTDLDGVVYFRKLGSALASGLGWLEERVPEGSAPLCYADIAMICMWQHLVHYAIHPVLERYPRLARHVARFATRASIAETTPTASLAEAEKAGWTPS